MLPTAARPAAERGASPSAARSGAIGSAGRRGAVTSKGSTAASTSSGQADGEPAASAGHGDRGHLASRLRRVRVVPLNLLVAPLRPVIRIRRGALVHTCSHEGAPCPQQSGGVLESPGLDAGGRRTSGARYA